MSESSNIADQTPAPEAPAVAKKYSGVLKSNMREYGMLFALVMIMAYFQWQTGGILMKPVNLTNLILQNSYVIIMALGMLMVIVAGYIDLSVGSVAGVIGGLAGSLIVTNNFPVLPTVIICLVVGALIGAAQGYFIAFKKIPSFIVTLAGMLVFRGLTFVELQQTSLGPFPKSFQFISTGFIPDFFDVPDLRVTSLLIGVVVAAVLVVMKTRTRIAQLKYGMDEEPTGFFVAKNILFAGAIIFLSYMLSLYNGLPNVAVIMFGLIAVYDFVTNRTTIGRRVYAIGGNEKAAKLSGIKTERVAFFTFINMGVLAALAGLVVTARLNSATAKAGTGFELDVIAACFIGGASASGGVGKVMGAVIGAFIMGVMNNGMSIIGLGIEYQMIIKGLVLLAAVYLDVYNKNK